MPLHPQTTRAFRRSMLAVSLTIPAVMPGPAVAGAAAQEAFVGTIVYEASAGGPNADGASMFNSMGPSREVVTWGSGGRLRLETAGGMMAGVIIARMADSAFFTLDSATHVARGVWLQSLNVEDAEPNMLAFMQERFAPPEMERTNETASYAGHRCRMYRVSKSTMLRRGATARACIAENIRVRPSRYHFSWKGGMGQMAALPLQFGIREGLPLMLEVNENDTVITYRAVSLVPGEPADSLFSVPKGYTVLAREPGG